MVYDIDGMIDLSIKNDMRYCRKSIEMVADLQEQIVKTSKINIRGYIESKYISPALYPLVMSVLDIGEKKNKYVVLRCNVSNAKLTNLLNEHGVLAYYNHTEFEYKKDNKLLYTDLKNEDSTIEIVNKINSLLPVNMSSKYRDRFTSKLYEIFINSQKHSCCKIPAKANAYKKDNYFYISLYDAGVGIPFNVRRFSNLTDVSDIEAMKWAFIDGHSAADNSKIISRGSGLGIIESFVKENRGKMFFVSGKALYHIHNNKAEYIVLQKPIMGTFVTIRINVDKEHIYATPEEVKS